MIKKAVFYTFILFAVMLTSCSKYQKLLKSTDNDLKYETAMDFYEKKDYNRALELFDLLQASFRGTGRGEEISYHMAYSYYYLKDYTVASFYFKRHAQTYPNSARAEECMFMNAYCYYLDSPKPSLDQSNTYLAIKELQTFMDSYPKSERIAECNDLIDNLREKLELKDFNIAILYYRMSDYEAAITSFKNLMKNYPDTDRSEEILYNMAVAYYEYAEKSIAAKQRERYELSLESYNNLRFQYPESPYLKSLETIQARTRNKLANQN
jgi:outer membrane protein assembly factor BamD